MNILSLYRYLEENKYLLNKKYLLKLFRIFTTAITSQYRYLLVLYSLKHLKDYSDNIIIQTNMIYILSNIIKNGNGSFVTYIEVLDILTKCLFENIQNGDRHTDGEIENLEKAYIECINSFSTNINYPEQINDIMSFLIDKLDVDRRFPTSTTTTTTTTNSSSITSKFIVPVIAKAAENGYSSDSKTKVAQSSESTSSLSTTTTPSQPSNPNEEENLLKCRIIIMRSLRFILEQRKDAIEKNELLYNTPLSTEIFTPIMALIKSPSVNLRLEVYFFLLLLMDQINGFTNSDDNKSYSTKCRFMQTLHMYLYDYVQRKDNNPVDYIIIINLFIKNIELYSYEDIISVIPLIFELEEMAKQRTKSKEEIIQQQAMTTLIVEFFEYLAEYLEYEPLSIYIEKIKTSKINENEWCKISFKTAVISQWLNKTFKDTDIDISGLKTCENYLDKEYIISILCENEELKTQSNDLSELLHQRYIKNDILKLIKKHRPESIKSKRTSVSSLRDPKLVRVSIPPPNLRRDITHASIHIEDLKEVLGSFEQLDKLHSDENLLPDSDDEVKLTDEVNVLLDEITSESRNMKSNKSVSTTLINQPIISSYEKLNYSSLKRPQQYISNQDEYPMVSMDSSHFYPQDSFINDYSLHYVRSTENLLDKKDKKKISFINI